MRKYKIWKLKEFNKEQAENIARELNISIMLASILLTRGLSDLEEIREFLWGSKNVYHEPLLMKDMQKASERILQAVKSGEKITVYGDYDVDGITSTSLVYLFLKEQGANIDSYIPKRKGEGYGLNTDALKTIHENGTRLIITVDCGISAVDEVANAPADMDIIITDHHCAPEVLPAAYAIVNPKQPGCEYPYKHLAGVGVALKLCQAIYQMEHLQEPLWEGYIELVALGTVADIVPLRGENREIVKRGLKALETTKILGLQKLMEVSNCPKVNITSENIGFMLAPRLNAVGRLEHAQSAVGLLTTNDVIVAKDVAETLNKENYLRQEISHKIYLEAEALIAKIPRLENAIVLANADWHAGVIGIVASRLVDKYNLPTILLSIDGDTAKGSCRSIPALDLYDVLNECSDYLVQFGGHHQAAGLTIKTNRLEGFVDKFKAIIKGRLSPEDFKPKLAIDALLTDADRIDMQLMNEISLLEPYGAENPAPLLALKDAKICNPRTFGKDQNHLRFFVEHDKNSFHSIMWNGNTALACLYNDAIADIAFMPKINIWNGAASINLQVVAFDQTHEIYDYRNEVFSKKALLRKILQLKDNVTVFLNERSVLDPEFDAYTDLKVRYYGTKDPVTSSIVVFYDLPKLDIFTEESFPLDSKPGRTLIILFNRDDYNWNKEDLGNIYPDRYHLEKVYKHIMCVLRKQAIADVESLKASAKALSIELSDNDLKIFEELGFIKNECKHISCGSIAKSDLSNSETYNKLNQKGCDLRKAFDNSINISRGEISAIWEK